MKLYQHELSGHSHRVRLLIGLLGLDAEILPVDLLSGAHKQPDFLEKNPFGQVPVLEDGDMTLSDSNAILVYLASQYDSDRSWYPTDPEAAAGVQIWLSKAANELANGPAAARLVTVFNAGYDHAALIEKSHHFLKLVNNQLATSEFVAGVNPTIADVALYSYIAHAPEGGVDLVPYASIRGWLTRIEALPGFVPMRATETKEKQALAA